MSNARLFVGTTLLVVWLVSFSVGAAIPSSERAALIALYNATDGDNWDRNDGWLGPVGTECDWWGVVCGADQVVFLWLSWNNLTGHIPSEVQNLAGLWELDLHWNQLSGPIPSEISTMSNLGGLYLSWNEFDPGPVPAWIANLPNLSGLALSGTRRSGPLPEWIGSLSNLTVIDLGFNSFDTGTIPQQWSQLTNLEVLWLDAAHLTGGIPSWLGQCSNMESLNLSRNQLSGSVPQELGGLEHLRLLYLSDNSLTGSLPDFFSGMADLTDLSLYDNNFNPSPLPQSLRNLQNLRLVKIDNLTGQLPAWIGNWVTIDTLFLWDGQLTGPIPDSIGQLTDLDNLWLKDNQLGGELPSSMLNLTDLEDAHGLDICGNSLSTNNAQLRDFLNTKQVDGDWEGCQTGSSQSPDADFSWTPLWPLSGEPVVFSDESTNSPASWSWTFGDGGTSSQQNPSHTYQSAGSYQVTLTVSNSHGSDSVTKTVTVATGGSPPVADFTWTPTSPEVGQSVKFSDQSSSSPTSWAWTFGDGGSSSARNPSHTFQSAGSYSVTLTATNAYGSDSVTKSITVVETPGNTVTVGGITFTADTVQTTSFGYRLTGVVSINDVLRYEGTLEIKNPGGGSSNFRMEGDGQLSMPQVSIPGFGTLVLYDGSFSIPFLDGSLFDIPEDGTGVKVAGWVIRIDDLDFAGGGIEVAGALSIPQYSPGLSNIYAAASVRISEANGIELLSGELDIAKIQLYGAFSLESLHVSYDRDTNSFSGEGELKTAAFGLGVGVEIIDSCPNGVTITVTHPHVNIPNTPLALANYGIEATGFCPTYTFGVGLHTDITILGLPDPDLLSFADLYVMYYPLTTLSGGGKVRFLKVDLASADFYVNDGANGCAGGVCFRTMLGLPSLEEPWLLGQAEMRIMADPLEFAGTQSMTVQIPDVDNLPALARTIAFGCCGGDYPCAVGEASVASRVAPFGDPIGEFNARVSTCLFGLSADVTVTYSEGGDDEFHIHFFEDGEMVKLAAAPQGLAASSTEFEVPDGTTDAYFLAEARNSITPDFSIVDPDGVRFDEDGGVGIAYVEDKGNHTVMFGAENPTPGIWSLEVSNLAPQDVELTAYTLGTLTTVEIVDVAPGGGDVQVSWRSVGPSAGDTVDLLYCAAFDGPPAGKITEGLAASSSQQNTTWDTVGVPAGIYYVRARTGNGLSQHTFEEPVVVTNASAPQAPVNLQGNTAGTSAVALTWQPSPSPGVTGYIVSFREGAASQAIDIGVGDVTSYRLEGLDSSSGYEIWVSAHDGGGIRSEPGNVIRLAWAECDLACSTTAPAFAGRGDPVQFGSTVTSIGCAGEPRFEWMFGDATAGNESSPRHTFTESDTFSWTFTVRQDDEMCGSSGVISVEDHTCTLTVLSPGGVAPVTRGGTSTVSWTAAGTVCTSNFDLDLYRFGSLVEPLIDEVEGSNFVWHPSSDLGLGDGYQIRVRDHDNPTYEGFSAGFSLAESSFQSPAIAAAGDNICVVPAAAHVTGVGDTNWVTDVVLNNPGEVASNVNIYFLPRSQDNRTAPGRRMTVAPGEARRLDDIVLGTFGHDSAAGALLVGSSTPLVVTSRIYNDADSGTFGQFVPGGNVGGALTTGDEARLIQLTRTSGYRTNIGFANAGDRPIEVEVRLYRANKAFIGREDYSLTPYGSYQANGIINVNVNDAYAVVSSSSPSAEYFTYASIVDNLSGDSVYVTPVDEVSGDAIYVPGVAHVAGAGGTNWRTDLEVHNPGSGTVTFRIELLKRDQANSSPASRSYSLGAGFSRRFTDVVESVFGATTTGAIRVTPVSGTLSATSRTYNDAASGTFGQFIAGLPSSAGIASGMTARISQLEYSAASDRGFRTNVGFVNDGSARIDVEVGLFDGSGDSLGSVDLTLRPFEFHQINDIFGEVTTGDVNNGYAVVRTTTPGGRFFTYGSVVDNRSGDPIYIPGVPFGEAAASPPSTAPALTVSAASSSRIDVNWTSVSGSTGYKLYRGSTLIYNGSNRSYADTGLNAGTQYCYKVKAYNAAGDGPISATRCVTTHSTPPPTSAPNLTATTASTSRIDLSWTSVTTATGYRLYRGSSMIYEGTSRSYADTGLAAGTEYCYTVFAFNGAGNGPESTPVCSTTQSDSPECGDWEWVNNGATNQHLFGVTWGAGQFVAVGTGGAIVTSPDGVTWSTQSSGSQEFLVRVAYGSGRFVVVGHNGTVLTSNNGVSWSPSSVATSENLVDVAWVNNTFIATGTGGVIFESATGVSWAPRSSGTNYVLNGASWTGSKYVIVGSEDYFADGIVLVGNTTSSLTVWPNGQPVDGALFNNASEGDGVSVAVGRSGYILYIDPNTSTPTTVMSPTTDDLYAVDVHMGRHTAVGYSGVVLTSADGLIWTMESSGTSRALYGVVLGDGVNVAVGQVGTTIRQECGR